MILVQGGEESRKFIQKYLAIQLPSSPEQLEKSIHNNAVVLLGDVMNIKGGELLFKYVQRRYINFFVSLLII